MTVSVFRLLQRVRPELVVSDHGGNVRNFQSEVMSLNHAARFIASRSISEMFLMHLHAVRYCV